MSNFNLLELFSQDENCKELNKWLENNDKGKIHLKNTHGSQISIIAASIINKNKVNNLFILDNLEDALYFLDDLNNLNTRNSAYLFPSSERINRGDKNVLLERINVLKLLNTRKNISIVTYPDAVLEKVITKDQFQTKKISLKKGSKIDVDELLEHLNHLNFNNTDFVLEPGDYAVRGLIIDIFSFDNDTPYRIIMDDNTIEEISCFNVGNQMSLEAINQIDIVSNVQEANNLDTTSFFTYLSNNSTIWVNNPSRIWGEITQDKFVELEYLKGFMNKNCCIYTGNIINNSDYTKIIFNSNTQSTFNQNFELLINHLDEYKTAGYKNIITVSSENQMKRLTAMPN